MEIDFREPARPRFRGDRLEAAHERETKAIEETIARRQRLQRIAIVVLLALLVALGAYVLFTL